MKRQGSLALVAAALAVAALALRAAVAANPTIVVNSAGGAERDVDGYFQ